MVSPKGRILALFREHPEQSLPGDHLLLVKEDGLGLEATLSHDPSGEEKEIYEDVRYDFPIMGDRYDLEKLLQSLRDLKQEYPRHEEIVFLVDDKVSYDVIVQAMDTCRREYYEEEGKRRVGPCSLR